MKKGYNNLFNIIQKWRHFLVVFLLVVFFSPYGIKGADMVVHHHYTSHYKKLADTEYTIEGHFCPIPGFQYKTFLFQQAVEKPESILFLHKIHVFSTEQPFINRYSLSFSLRAPPLLDNIS